MKKGHRATAAPREPFLKPFDFKGWEYQMPELGVAEGRARVADDIVEQYAGEGKRNLAKEEREVAAWWRRLGDLPDSKAPQLYNDCHQAAEEAIDILLARAEKSDAPLTTLGMIASRLLSGLHALAAHDNKAAARVWAGCVYESANDFEMLAFNKPEIFREWARGCIALPGCISRHTEKQEGNLRLLELLEQGKDCPFAILPTGKTGRKWKFQDRANALAGRLWSHIENARLLYDVHALEAQHAGRGLPEWLRDAAKLEPLSAATWPTWAETAWKVIAEISPDGNPELHPAFYDPATKICNVRTQRKDPYFDKIVTSPSIAKDHIKEAILGAFELVATGVSQRTKQRRKACPDN